MKLRNGFVSNSSSSSFVIDRKYVNEKMLEDIYDHENLCAVEDIWTIKENEKEIYCSTWLDNFDLLEYIGELGIPEEAIRRLE